MRFLHQWRRFFGEEKMFLVYYLTMRHGTAFDIHAFLLGSSKSAHPPLHSLFSKNGEIISIRRNRKAPFIFLARTLVWQQLSWNAANSIWDRINRMCKDEGLSLFEFCAQDPSALKTCGLSKNKLNAISLLVRFFADGRGRAFRERLKSAGYDDVTILITGLHGFGRWSADMVAIFHLGIPDVWPATDGALGRGLDTLFGRLGEARRERVVEVYAPYRSFLALHRWKGLGGSVNMCVKRVQAATPSATSLTFTPSS